MKKTLVGLSIIAGVAIAATTWAQFPNLTHREQPDATTDLTVINASHNKATPQVQLMAEQKSTVPGTRSITAENNLPGTSSWRIHKPANGRIQGYTSLDSVNAGGRLTFYISTQRNGTYYRIRFYRMGWYHGAGGRLVAQSPLLRGRGQGWWNASTGRHYLPAPNKNGLLSLNWHPSYQVTVPTNWVSGYYLALLTDQHGYQSYVPFVVRDDTHAHAFLVESPVATWQAYNAWGDYSFYGHYVKWRRRWISYYHNGANEVSFNRPYATDNGAGLTFLELPTVYWLESKGYDVSYTTSTGIDQPTAQWTPKAIISVGHDEYWSANMRDNVTKWQNQGVSFAFFGANDMYWRIRYTSNDRTLIGYRWASDLDPLRGTPLATGPWRRLGLPENRFLGEEYSGQPSGLPRWVVSNPNFWLFNGLHIYRGESVPQIIGWEYDSAINEPTTQKGLYVVSQSPLKDRILHNRLQYATTSLYQAPSGAYVFNAGTIWWGYGLSNPMGYQIDGGMGNHIVDWQRPSPIIQGVTANLLNKFLNNKDILTQS